MTVQIELTINEFECTLKLSYHELGYNEHSVITNKEFGPKCPFTTQIDLVITNPGYNERFWLVLSCSLQPSFTVFYL